MERKRERLWIIWYCTVALYGRHVCVRERRIRLNYERQCLVAMSRKPGERTQREFLLGLAAFISQNSLKETEREREERESGGGGGPASLPCRPPLPSVSIYLLVSNSKQSIVAVHSPHLCTLYFIDNMRDRWICNVRLLVIIDVGSWAPPWKLPATAAQNVTGCLAWHVPVFFPVVVARKREWWGRQAYEIMLRIMWLRSDLKLLEIKWPNNTIILLNSAASTITDLKNSSVRQAYRHPCMRPSHEKNPSPIPTFKIWNSSAKLMWALPCFLELR